MSWQAPLSNMRALMLQKKKHSKYRSVKTLYNGRLYDSALEAGHAQQLDLMLKAREIVSWEPQYVINMIPHDELGKPYDKLRIQYKVDFRVLRLDGSYILVESKGKETPTWRMKDKWLRQMWLPKHIDHDYMVVKHKSIGCLGQASCRIRSSPCYKWVRDNSK